MRPDALRTWRDIVDSCRSQPGRILLSFLAITVGMIALTVLLAVLDGLNRRAGHLSSDLGIRVIGVAAENTGDAGPGLNLRHAALLREALPGCLVSCFNAYNEIPDGKETAVTIVAVDEYFMRVKAMRLSGGRFLDATDIAEAQRHAVISRSVARECRWDNGSTFSFQQLPFKVVGILEIESGAAEQEEAGRRFSLSEHTILVPLTVRPLWEQKENLDANRITGMLIQVPESQSYDVVLEKAMGLLAQPDLNAGQLSWVTPDQLVAGIRKIQQTIRLTAGSIAMLCLVLGGTTLMSLMVANVRDRITEIGLRRALGASRRDIAVLFMLEGCLVTFAASLAGNVVTALLLWLARNLFPVPVTMTASTVLLPLSISLGLGMLFSFWPARAAASISPADALRND